MCARFVVDENDDEADYDNVRSRDVTVSVNTNSLPVWSVTYSETVPAVHTGQRELTATETVMSSGVTDQLGSTKAKKEKKKFLWGQKKKKKPQTAAGKHDWGADKANDSDNHWCYGASRPM